MNIAAILDVARKSGAEVLAEIKAEPALAMIPIVVLTTSESEEDVLRAYRHHANAYITKPPSFDLFTEAIQRVDDFFLTLV